MEGLTIRKGERMDCPQIMKLIHELAVFEKMPEQVAINGDTLISDGFDSDPPYFRSLVAEFNGKVIGYALYFFSYSTHEGGEFLYLEDLFVTESYRGKGVGKRLLSAVVKTAEDKRCLCVQWCVLNWNKKAIGFYQYLGAFDLTLSNNRHMYRLNQDKYDALLT